MFTLFDDKKNSNDPPLEKLQQTIKCCKDEIKRLRLQIKDVDEKIHTTKTKWQTIHREGETKHLVVARYIFQLKSKNVSSPNVKIPSLEDVWQEKFPDSLTQRQYLDQINEAIEENRVAIGERNNLQENINDLILIIDRIEQGIKNHIEQNNAQKEEKSEQCMTLNK